MFYHYHYPLPRPNNTRLPHYVLYLGEHLSSLCDRLDRLAEVGGHGEELLLQRVDGRREEEGARAEAGDDQPRGQALLVREPVQQGLRERLLC